MKTLGQRIYFVRHAQGRQTLKTFGAAVAKMEGKAKPYADDTVSAWENSKEVPRLGALIAIKKLGNVRWEFLLEGVGQPYQNTDKLSGAA